MLRSTRMQNKDSNPNSNWQKALDQFDIPDNLGKYSPRNTTNKINKNSTEVGIKISTQLFPRLTILAGCIIAIGNIPLQSYIDTNHYNQFLNNTTLLDSKGLTSSIQAVTKNTPTPLLDVVNNPVTPKKVEAKIVSSKKNLLKKVEAQKPLSQIKTSIIAHNKPLTDQASDFLAETNKQLKEGEKLSLTKPLQLPKHSIETFSTNFNGQPINDNKADWSTLIIKTNTKLSHIAKKLNIQASIKRLNSNNEIQKKLNNLKPGDIIRTKVVKNRLSQLIIQKNNSRKSFVVEQKGNQFKTKYSYKLVELRQSRKIINITNSWRYNANKMGVSSHLITQINNIFDRDVKLYQDLKKGDRVTLIFDSVYHNGEKVAEGDIIAAELVHDNRTHRAVRYIFNDGRINYYTPEGMNLNTAFKRHPLAKPYRITSRFSYNRFHPILKRYRPHTGTDYGAPRGTPIYATGNGVIKFAGYKGSYGKTIILKHGSGYTTSFSHMQGYAKNIRSGKKVFLGDLIGYVGNTGRSTGPHLHYEFRINGKPHNSLSVQLPKALSLQVADLKKFRLKSQSLVLQLNVLYRFVEAEVDLTNGFGG